MALTDTLPKLSEFTTSVTDQATFFDAVRDTLNTVCEIAPITMIQTDPPTQLEFEAAWLADNVTNTLPIPINREFIWFDSVAGEIRGVYQTIQDVVSNLTMVSIRAGQPAISLEGKVAYFKNNHDVVSPTILYRQLFISSLSGEETSITALINDPDSPTWNDTGTQLAYHSKEYVATWEISKINSDGTGLTRLTTNAFNDVSPHWRGSNITFASDEFTSPSYQIFTMTDAGAGRTRLTNNAFSDTAPQYSPSGTQIVFVSNRTGDTQVWIMDSNGANQTQVTSIIGGIGTEEPSFSNDGVWIYFGERRIKPNGTDLETWYTQPEALTLPLSQSERYKIWVETFRPNTATQGISQVAVGPTDTYALGRIATSVYFPIIVAAIPDDDNLSTSKVYRVSQFVDPTGNIRLLKYYDSFDGVISSMVLDANELPDDIEHLMVLIDGVGTAVGGVAIRFNHDADANNYMTMRQVSNNAVITRTERAPGVTAGIEVLLASNSNPPNSESAILIWIPAIKQTDSLKQLLFEGSQVLSYTTPATNMSNQHGVGMWNNDDPITSVSFTHLTGAFVAGSRITIYGFPGTPRFDME